MSERGKSNWELLALELGAEIKPDASQASESAPLPPARQPAPERKRVTAQRPERRTDWNELAGQLGLEVKPPAVPQVRTPRPTTPAPIRESQEAPPPPVSARTEAPPPPAPPAAAPPPPAAPASAAPPSRPAPPREELVRRPRTPRSPHLSQPLEEIGPDDPIEPIQYHDEPLEREPQGAQGDEGEGGRRRKRRRRGGRKDLDAPRAAEERRDPRRRSPVDATAHPLEEIDAPPRDSFDDEDELTLPEFDPSFVEAEAVDEDEGLADEARAEESRPRRRRRRRGGARKRREREAASDSAGSAGEESTLEERTLPPARAARPARPQSRSAAVEVDDSVDADLDLDVEDDDDSKEMKGHRHIPSWDDAIGHIVAINMESRAKNPNSSSSGPRGRGGRGNGSGHRGRGGRSSGS